LDDVEAPKDRNAVFFRPRMPTECDNFIILISYLKQSLKLLFCCGGLAMTLEGRINRNYLPTREQRGGHLVLRGAARPVHEAQWLDLAGAQ
jgi:hypothetical protein